jgi:hypothetical protein
MINICPKGMTINPHPHNAINTNDLACLDYDSYINGKKTNHDSVDSKKINCDVGNQKNNYNGADNQKTNHDNNNDKKETIGYPNIRTQLFSLNNLSLNELKSKWIELYKSNPNNFQRGYLIKGLAYKIQSLYGMSNASEEEVKTSLKMAKQKLKANNVVNNVNCYDELNYVVADSNKNKSESENKNINANNSKNKIEGKNNNINTNNNKNETKTKKQIFLPPVGSVISAYHNNTKYMVKILEDNKFSYNNKIYKSLSAIANEITGTRWSGYAFFHLK